MKKPRRLDASRILLTPDDIERIDAHLDASLQLTPEQRLKKLGEFMRFIWKHMTPEGRKIFLAEREHHTRLKDVEARTQTRS